MKTSEKALGYGAQPTSGRSNGRTWWSLGSDSDAAWASSSVIRPITARGPRFGLTKIVKTRIIRLHFLVTKEGGAKTFMRPRVQG